MSTDATIPGGASNGADAPDAGRRGDRGAGPGGRVDRGAGPGGRVDRGAGPGGRGGGPGASDPPGAGEDGGDDTGAGAAGAGVPPPVVVVGGARPAPGTTDRYLGVLFALGAVVTSERGVPDSRPRVVASAVGLLRRLRAAGVATAVVADHEDAAGVLAVAAAAGAVPAGSPGMGRGQQPAGAPGSVAGLFDVGVDGNGVVGAGRGAVGLAAAPDPARRLQAAERLGAFPGTCAAVETTPAGVLAARRAGIDLVVAVAADGTGPDGGPDPAGALRRAGADVVVADLAEVPDRLFFAGDPWLLAYRGVDPATEGAREALLAVGNGVLATRGSMCHERSDGTHYPGTYVAGTFDRLTSVVEGRERSDESIVNLPDWLPLTFRSDGGPWLSSDRWSLSGYRVALDLRNAVLTRTATVTDGAGRRTSWTERRLVSMADPRLAALQVRLVAENWSGRLQLRSVVDGGVVNANVATHRQLNGRHLRVVATRAGPPAGRGNAGSGDASRRAGGADRLDGAPLAVLVAETVQSRIRVAVATRTEVHRAGGPAGVECRPAPGVDVAGHELALDVRQGEEVVVTKTAAVVTSRHPGISEPALAAEQAVAGAPRFEVLLADHAREWSELWHQFGIELHDGTAASDRLAVRAHVLHLLQSISPHTAGHDAGVPARGLHGEGYRGHVFWDELFVLPIVDLRVPELARNLLLYRWRRLPEARRRAAAAGGRGALFPWQSGSDGSEETEPALFNPLSGTWMADHSRLQYHVDLAVAVNTWRHWQVTGDLGFLSRHGAELLVETARFFASRATYDAGADRYDLRRVMGPDEFHDGYPDRPGEGIDNNAYVNVMASWALARAREAYDLLGPNLGRDLWSRLQLGRAEIDRWDRVSRRLRVPFLDNGLLAQFEGFGDLEHLDWRRYRARYGDIARLDLVLQAEGDSTNRYQVSKQADVLMLFHLLSAEELTALLGRLGYDFDPARIPETVDHYLARTSHGSSLSRVVHAWVLARTDRARSWALLRQALATDLAGTAQRTTGEGIHLGAAAGTLDILQRCYTGLDAREDALHFNPLLPDDLRSLRFLLRYRNQLVTVEVGHEHLRLTSAPGPAAPIDVVVRDERAELAAGATLRFRLPAERRRRPARTLGPLRPLGPLGMV